MSGADRELDRDLRATVDDLRGDARELEGLERRKGELGASDPRAAELAAKAEDITRRMARKAVAERILTDEARRAG